MLNSLPIHHAAGETRNSTSLSRLHEMAGVAVDTSLDDDSSASSTIPVTSSFKPIVHDDRYPSNNNKRTVSFNEAANEIYDNTVMDKEDCIDSWYSAQDYALFKASTKFLAREIILHESKKQRIRNSKKAAASSNNSSYQQVLERTYFELDHHHHHHHYDLQQWMRVTTCRLGLERLTIRSIAKDRSQRRVELVETVLDLQDDNRYNNNNNNNNSISSVLAAAEILQHASEEYSRTSRLFALNLAVALQDSITSSSSASSSC
jgi:hypothetical protein